MKANESVVDIRGLTKVFRDFWRRPKVKAVDGIDLDVRRGEIFGLLGPNGSGKSTVIKMLLGLLYPTHGTVRVLGMSPRDVRSKAAIGYLPEESYLYGYLSSRETLDFYARLFGIGRAERRNRAEQLLEMTGLKHASNRPVGEFSKGMMRRIGFAQALINNPELIILDEPTSGLDPIGCRQVKDLMETLARRGKTILLCSHLLADVEDVCDRIAILYNGRIRAEGTVKKMLEKQESLTFTTRTLAPEKTAEALETLGRIAGGDVTVGHPSMNLERYFLEVVEEAHRTATEQSGVSRASGMAEYLTHE